MKLSIFNSPKETNQSRDLPIGRLGTTAYLKENQLEPMDSVGRLYDKPNTPFYTAPPGKPKPFDSTIGSIQNQILNRLYWATGVSGIILFASELPYLIQNSLWLGIGIISLALVCFFVTALYAMFVTTKIFSLSFGNDLI